MFSLIDPRVWGVAVLWTVLVAFAGNWHGSSTATEAARIDEAGRTATALQGQKDADAIVLADERKLRDEDKKRLDTFFKENDDAKNEDAQLIADLRSDNKRLRIPIIRAPDQAEAAGNRPAASGTGEEGYAELTPDAGVFLVGLLARGDEAIRKHAEVVDRFERSRLLCTSDPSEAEGVKN